MSVGKSGEFICVFLYEFVISWQFSMVGEG